MDWAIEEMQGIDLGDKRLTKRLLKLLNILGNNAFLSIPSACGGWAETKAAYRFFDNAKVTAEKIIFPHKQATLERISHHKTVLLLQVDFGHFKTDRNHSPQPATSWPTAMMQML